MAGGKSRACDTPLGTQIEEVCAGPVMDSSFKLLNNLCFPSKVVFDFLVGGGGYPPRRFLRAGPDTSDGHHYTAAWRVLDKERDAVAIRSFRRW